MIVSVRPNIDLLVFQHDITDKLQFVNLLLKYEFRPFSLLSVISLGNGK